MNGIIYVNYSFIASFSDYMTLVDKMRSFKLISVVSFKRSLLFEGEAFLVFFSEENRDGRGLFSEIKSSYFKSGGS